MYSQKVLDIFYNPQNVGVIKGANAVGKVVDDTCGEILKIYVTVAGSKIEDAKFQAYGSPAAIAATATATALIIGKTIEEASKVNSDQILAELGGELPDNKKYVCPLAEKAIKNLVANYHKKASGKSAEDEE